LGFVKNNSTFIKTLWPACTPTSSKDRWIVAYSTGLTILGKLGCPIKKKYCICPLKWIFAVATNSVNMSR
jgi:hypothetical protein